MDEVPKNSVGVSFNLTIRDETGAVVDTSAATDRKIYFRKPSGTVVEKAASQVSGGTIRYTTIAGDLDEVGLWRLSAKVTIASGAKPSKINQFEVVDTLG